MNKVRLHIDKISPGMKLAEPITTPAGITLMPAGIRLTPMFIARIKKWNVEELDVFVDGRLTESARVISDSEMVEPIIDEQKPVTQKKGDTKQKPEEKRKLTQEEANFARNTAMEVSRPFVNVKDNPIMMQLRMAVIKQLVAKGPLGAINILRRQSSGQNERGNS